MPLVEFWSFPTMGLYCFVSLSTTHGSSSNNSHKVRLEENLLEAINVLVSFYYLLLYLCCDLFCPLQCPRRNSCQSEEGTEKWDLEEIATFMNIMNATGKRYLDTSWSLLSSCLLPWNDVARMALASSSWPSQAQWTHILYNYPLSSHNNTTPPYPTSQLGCSQVCSPSESGNLCVTRKSSEIARKGTWTFIICQSFFSTTISLCEEMPLWKGAVCPSFCRKKLRLRDII